MTAWEDNLEIVGAELFQRYRKRLMVPGITWEIQRDYPGLSLLDVLLRVHAGRSLIRDGDDFIALQAIRSGAWERIVRSDGASHAIGDNRRDRLSRLWVGLGGVVFLGFCLLSLGYSLAGEPWGLAALTTTAGLGVMAVMRRIRQGTVEPPTGVKVCGIERGV